MKQYINFPFFPFMKKKLHILFNIIHNIYNDKFNFTSTLLRNNILFLLQRKLCSFFWRHYTLLSFLVFHTLSFWSFVLLSFWSFRFWSFALVLLSFLIFRACAPFVFGLSRFFCFGISCLCSFRFGLRAPKNNIKLLFFLKGLSVWRALIQMVSISLIFLFYIIFFHMFNYLYCLSFIQEPLQKDVENLLKKSVFSS